MVIKNFKMNVELNAGVILASSNFYTKSPIEPAGDKPTQVEAIRS